MKVIKYNKYLLLLIILCIHYFSLENSFAQMMLTDDSDNIAFLYPDNGSDPAIFSPFAKDYRKLLLEDVYPTLPKEILSVMDGKKINFSFAPISLGGIFHSPASGKSEIEIQLKMSAMKLPATRSRLLHEWFHALHWYLDPEEPSWVKEGLAYLFVYRSLHGVLQYPGVAIQTATSHSNTGLEHVFSIHADEEEAYGHTFLYFLYLYRNCGGEDLFWKLAKGDSGSPRKTGRQWIDEVLKGSDSTWCGSFENTAIQAEIGRFHQAGFYVKGMTGLDQHYNILLDDQGRTPELQMEGFKNLSDFSVLKTFQPKLFPGTRAKELQKIKFGTEYKVFTLRHDFPHTVSTGMIGSESLAGISILVMKIK